MTSPELFCWKCNQALTDLLLPVPRLAKCKTCKADLHVCRMCEFFDTTVSNSCREPVAEKVNDKTRANFCGYFQPGSKPGPGQAVDADANRESLEALFGMEQNSSELSKTGADRSRQELEALFGLEDGKKK